MDDVPAERITSLLRAWKEEGDREAGNEAFRLLHPELLTIGRKKLREMESLGHKVEATELIGELYLKLARHDGRWQNRHYFLGMVAEVMENLLRDMVRHDRAQKRPRSLLRVGTTVARGVAQQDDGFEAVDFLLQLDRLRALNARHAEVVRLHYLAEATIGEIAESLGVAAVTVKRDLRAARAWWSQTLPEAAVRKRRAGGGA